MANKRERLFGDFPPVSKEQWLEKVTVDLKGASFDKRLVWRTPEGFNLQLCTDAKTLLNMPHV